MSGLFALVVWMGGAAEEELPLMVAVVLSAKGFLNTSMLVFIGEELESVDDDGANAPTSGVDMQHATSIVLIVMVDCFRVMLQDVEEGGTVIFPFE
mmetsp:Transcript_36784/g.77190  ORF Transcript_36784/g.77190 Transcript_36784/m.77190 type:complete len:96 (+) Transcript_36784:33-320(+)